MCPRVCVNVGVCIICKFPCDGVLIYNMHIRMMCVSVYVYVHACLRDKCVGKGGEGGAIGL